jgi:hypothetical protein
MESRVFRPAPSIIRQPADFRTRHVRWHGWSFDECLVWVTAWGIWGSGEDWPAFYAWRGAQNEQRSLEKAPGHRFVPEEIEKLTPVQHVSADTLARRNLADRTDGLRPPSNSEELLVATT